MCSCLQRYIAVLSPWWQSPDALYRQMILTEDIVVWLLNYFIDSHTSKTRKYVLQGGKKIFFIFVSVVVDYLIAITVDFYQKHKYLLSECTVIPKHLFHPVQPKILNIKRHKFMQISIFMCIKQYKNCWIVFYTGLLRWLKQLLQIKILLKISNFNPIWCFI